jgi:hypothetical protein
MFGLLGASTHGTAVLLRGPHATAPAQGSTVNDDRPSIAELWNMLPALRQQRSTLARKSADNALHRAAPALVEIVAAALAWQAVTCDLQSCETDDHTVAVMRGECAGDTHHESCAVARHMARLIEALSKVTP